MTFTIPAWLLYTAGVCAIVSFLIFAYLILAMIRFIVAMTETKAPPRIRRPPPNWPITPKRPNYRTSYYTQGNRPPPADYPEANLSHDEVL